MTKYVKFGSLAVLGLVLSGFIRVGQNTHADHSPSLNITFVNHLQARLPEQDVFIESKDNKSKVVRVEEEDIAAPAVLAKAAYATAKATPHDPFKLGPTPLGPFDKGARLGFTLGQWLDGIGSGSYSIIGAKAEMRLSFQKLVPKATYTVWCSMITLPPNFKVIDTPCGAADGSENIFKTDPKGNASFSLSLTPLADSTSETLSAIAVAYHSDGKTYGSSPGDFGKVSHVQLFYLIPPPPTQSPSPNPSPTVSQPAELAAGAISGDTVGWLIAVLVIIIVIVMVLARRKGSAV